jgi:class 3 adenylate cyclase
LSVKRRLSCILAADAVGFSKQMGSDEEGTVRVLSAHRAVIDGIITFHEGRIVSTAGDSVVAEFSSVVEAVRCAVEIQEALKTRNDSLSTDHRMLFRVGINLGDVVVKGNNVLGDGVNVAARLESIAEPGGVCISSSVYDQITGKLDLGFEDIGLQSLKNISRPIRVYRMSGIAVSPRTVARARPGRKSASWAIGALGAAVISAAVGWQTGWLRFGFAGGNPTNAVAPAVSTPPDPTAKANAPAVVPAGAAPANLVAPPSGPAAGSATTSTAGTTAGNTARSGAETNPQGAVGARRSYSVTQPQRGYAGTESLKYQAEAELARARANAAAGRGAATIVGGDTIGGRQRVQAEVDGARLRAEGEAVSGWRHGPVGSTPPTRK